MTLYFHAPTAGFYDTRAHGERTVLVADPKWKRPMISIPDPNWMAPEGSTQKAPTIKIQDPKATPPLVEVPNPTCNLPPASELLEITLSEYQALFAAQAMGNVISAVKGRPVAVDPPPLTWDQRKAEYLASVQAHLDTTAKNAGYNDLKDVITYADEPAVPKFQADGVAFRAWRSLCWAFFYDQLTAIEQGKRKTPTSAELVAELPALVLPNA
ncbi:hypothetical protein C9383_15925 [Pseudomonas palleroniana]|uniref:Uncharacterized protein n=1 Tax=Pseudomonas palleroniana TaxID=191390 RepID=A0A1H5LNA4_9PSED|nr:hypothetical protein [Pseudomonas palleroniana]KAB0566602.1 hypothetical protein F7R03_13570 [Pseudomonas palleroniana]PTC25588.1 hypothetical protein C9383_15925 [Pseudomonas palleroniana]SEE78480.1 hypothetical protein SAMN04490198_2838 [Pseudomonas palleroniana]